GRCRTVFFEQVFFERTAVDADADRNFLSLSGADDLAYAVDGTDVPGIDAEFVDARIQSFEREFVMEMDVGDDRHVRAFADLVHRGRGVVIRHGDADYLATGFDHFVDLFNCAFDIRRVRFGHRLDGDRSIAADLHIANHNGSGNSSHKIRPIRPIGAFVCFVCFEVYKRMNHESHGMHENRKLKEPRYIEEQRKYHQQQNDAEPCDLYLFANRHRKCPA